MVSNPHIALTVRAVCALVLCLVVTMVTQYQRGGFSKNGWLSLYNIGKYFIDNGFVTMAMFVCSSHFWKGIC
jgi:hypothetical protein